MKPGIWFTSVRYLTPAYSVRPEALFTKLSLRTIQRHPDSGVVHSDVLLTGQDHNRLALYCGVVTHSGNFIHVPNRGRKDSAQLTSSSETLSTYVLIISKKRKMRQSD
jgi:hypothetical protein